MDASRTCLETARDDHEARYPIRSRFKIYLCAADGCLTALKGAGVNLSEGGAAFLVDCELPIGALIHIELPNSRMTASGRVRSCVAAEGGWRIGMQFDAELIQVA